MLQPLLTMNGRGTRGFFWKAALIYVVLGVLVGVLLTLLWQFIPGEIKADGSYGVSGVKALPYLVLILGYTVFCVWSGICVGAKRYHDRNKSAWWLLIQLVPIVGPIWYFIEAGCLRGTVGPNRFGSDPLLEKSAAHTAIAGKAI